MSAKQHYLVGNLSLNSKKSALSVKAVIEQEESHLSPVVWVGVRYNHGQAPHGVQKASTSMVFNSVQLRTLANACKSIVRNGRTEYKKYADPSLAGMNGNKKMLTINRSERNQEAFYINIHEGGTDYGFLFDIHSLYAFSSSLSLLADEVERELYRHQRENATQIQGGQV